MQRKNIGRALGLTLASIALACGPGEISDAEDTDAGGFAGTGLVGNYPDAPPIGPCLDVVCENDQGDLVPGTCETGQTCPPGYTPIGGGYAGYGGSGGTGGGGTGGGGMGGGGSGGTGATGGSGGADAGGDASDGAAAGGTDGGSGTGGMADSGSGGTGGGGTGGLGGSAGAATGGTSSGGAPSDAATD